MQKSVFSRDYAVFLRHLREARRKAALTQVELGAKLRCTQSFVSKCERGERRIDVVELRQWCKALGVSFTAFAQQLDDAMK